MYLYLLDPTKTWHPDTHLNIPIFQELPTLKLLLLLLLDHKPLQRKSIKEKYDYHGKGETSIIVYFENSNDLIWICWKLQGFLIRKESTVKDTSIWQQRFWRILIQLFSTGSV